MPSMSRSEHAPPSIERLELAPPSDGARYQRLTLELEADGSLRLTSHVLGGSLQAAWGADDEEVTVRVSASQMGRLALAAAARCVHGRSDAVEALIELCDANDVPFEAVMWT